MSNLALDGNTSFIGTQFIKLLNTGTSNLATESYVDTAVANGGGGGGADLTNYYDKTETDGLLSTKLNINSPQNMEGTLNIGSVGGTSKIIINAVSSSKDFYVNGDAQVLGNHLVNSLDSTAYIKGASLITNTFNTDNLNDIFFQSNGATYASLDVSTNDFIVFKNLLTHYILKTDTLDTYSNTTLEIQRNNDTFLQLRTDIIDTLPVRL